MGPGSGCLGGGGLEERVRKGGFRIRFHVQVQAELGTETGSELGLSIWVAIGHHTEMSSLGGADGLLSHTRKWLHTVDFVYCVS